MWFIYISLCIGIIIGAKNLLPKKIFKLNDRFSVISVFALLFVMGISIGSNKDVINKLDTIGLEGLIFALFPVLFSIIVVYLLTSVLLRRYKR